MLVDLGRNDVGRVAEFGTVEDERSTCPWSATAGHAPGVERPRAMKGELRRSTPSRTFRPGRCPGPRKSRAMETSTRSEPCAAASMPERSDTSTTTATRPGDHDRTPRLRERRAYWGAGAGIVADSDPQGEWDETMNKGCALWMAVQRAERERDDGGRTP